jgi:hypothetical protein
MVLVFSLTYIVRMHGGTEEGTSTQKLYSGGSKHIYTGVFQYRQC